MKNYNYISKILYFAIGFVFMQTATFAQSSLTIEGSQVLSTFKFTDSLGTQDKSYSGIYSGAYALGYRYASEKGFLLHPRLGMRTGGATMVYDASNYSWNLKYVDLKIGVGYILKKERFSPYILVSPYYAYLLKATQILNNANYDIKNSSSLKQTDYGVFITPGIQFKASDSFSAFAEFNYMMGLQNLETDKGQEGYNRAYALTLGVAFTIASKNSTKFK